MDPTVKIIGAGMAGLLAANMIRDSTEIIESSPHIPNSHQALLRFRSSAVGDVCGIPFRKVSVMKTVESSGADVADALSYSRKVTGEYSLRSSSNSHKTEIVERYIAPNNLVELMAAQLNPVSFQYDHHVKEIHTNSILAETREGTVSIPRKHIISTVPMPTLMRLLDYQGMIPNFRHRPGFAVRFNVENANVNATVYIPQREIEAYRISITGSTVIVEYARDIDTVRNQSAICKDAIGMAEMFLGIPSDDISGGLSINKMQYAKIAPIEEEERRNFIMWASMKHNVFSLGRFATWRPGLLMDDVVNDVRVICRLMSGQSIYEHLLKG